MAATLSEVRFKRLKWLIAGTILWTTILQLPMQEYPEWVFWLFHASTAAALSICLLLSYWWGASTGAKCGRFFVVFVVSFLMLVGVATKALIVSAGIDQIFLSMARADMSCTLPVIACTSYLAESKPDKQAEWNSLFFGSSGANLDAAKNGTNKAVAPNEKSKLTWESSQTSEQIRRSAIKQINELRAVALNLFFLYVCISIIILTIGGWSLMAVTKESSY